MLFNAKPERELAERLFHVKKPGAVVGMGFDTPPPLPDGPTFRERHGIEGDFLLYFGRKESGKNVPFLLDAFRRCTGAGAGLSLVVAGDGSVESEPGVVDLPRLSEEDKRRACREALACCQPSTNESFSIVLMESWLEETPVLVHGECPVTRDHVRRSGGGLYFSDARDLAAQVEFLAGNPEWRRRLGRAGRRFVEAEYSWDAVLDRFEDGIGAIFAEAA